MTLDLPTFPLFRTYSRLRKYEFAEKRRQIRNVSYSFIHHAKFYADFESELKKIFLPVHFRENLFSRNLRGRIRKF